MNIYIKANMDREAIDKLIQRKRLEDNLLGEVHATVGERITRYQELDFIKLTPNTHFAFVSAECIHLYRDGYFLACIALSQAVAEAIARLMCVRSGFNFISQDFEENVRSLNKRGIQPDCDSLFKEIWKDRNDYHHLNPSIETEMSKLQAIAKSKIITLHEIESIVFEFAWVNGAVSPKFPKYWDMNKDGMLGVYLRFEP